MKNSFDVVVTHSESEMKSIMKPTESCQLVNGTTYTYLNKINLLFSIENNVTVGSIERGEK